MLFNSNQFIVFFFLVTTAYYLINHRFRKHLLLAASYYFYMNWNASYALLILFTTYVVYQTALFMIDKSDRIKKRLVFFSVFVNLAILFVFKYYNFFTGLINTSFSFFSIGTQFGFHDLLLPVGISFYTFQSLSYTVDVYRGHIKPQKDFVTFALYVSFFPQLVAGPIERSTHLLPQFFKKVPLKAANLKDGLQLMLWGFFQKMVIADRLAIYVNSIYEEPTKAGGEDLILATYFFAVQIYCDFAGYTDIARGASRVLGFDLMKNFNFPYFSQSIRDFWRRWHISLSSWFRDYLYIPLGGNRCSKLRWLFNLGTVFLLTGLWHGASINFVIWGALHGLYIFREQLIPINQHPYFLKLKTIKGLSFLFTLTNIFITFNLVCLSWIFFRAESFQSSIYIVQNLFNFNGEDVLQVYTLTETWLTIGLLSIFIMSHSCAYLQPRIFSKLKSNPWIRHSAYLFLIVAILFFSGVTKEKEFIYFQF